MSKLSYVDDEMLNGFSIAQLSEMIIVDIRSHGEHDAEHIEGSINIPVDDILTSDKSQFKDKVILFHCKGGVRTKANQHLLETFASKQSLCLEGGIDQWKNCGKPVKSL